LKNVKTQSSLVSTEVKQARRNALIIASAVIIAIQCLVYAFLVKQELTKTRSEIDQLNTELSKCRKEVVSKVQIEDLSQKLNN
jgi:uncharacterized protein YoxC